MTESEKKVRAVVAVPLTEELCGLIEELEPRLEVIQDASLVPPMRGPADWSGDPDFTRTPEQQRAFEALVDSADVLFGIPDVDPDALARTVSANPRLRWVMTTAAGGGSTVKAAELDRADLDRIVFTTSAGVHGGTLAEFALFAVLAGAKDLPRLRIDQDQRIWPERWEMRQVDEMTVLVVGLGGIGAECARRFHALGARVWGPLAPVVRSRASIASSRWTTSWTRWGGRRDRRHASGHGADQTSHRRGGSAGSEARGHPHQRRARERGR